MKRHLHDVTMCIFIYFWCSPHAAIQTKTNKLDKHDSLKDKLKVASTNALLCKIKVLSDVAVTAYIVLLKLISTKLVENFFNLWILKFGKERTFIHLLHHFNTYNLNYPILITCLRGREDTPTSQSMPFYNY